MTTLELHSSRSGGEEDTTFLPTAAYPEDPELCACSVCPHPSLVHPTPSPFSASAILLCSLGIILEQNQI